jgi:hypothetical protein
VEDGREKVVRQVGLGILRPTRLISSVFFFRPQTIPRLTPTLFLAGTYQQVTHGKYPLPSSSFEVPYSGRRNRKN